MPPQFPDTQIGDAVHAAAEHQLYRTLRGYGWVSGSAATPVPGATQVEVDSSASVWIDSSEVPVSSSGNVADLQPHGEYPRWATIVVEDTGNVTAVMGEVNKPVQLDDGTRVTGRQAPRPQPPVITDTGQCVYAFVWVPANAAEIQPEHIVDRRIDARVDAYNFNVSQYSDSDAVAAAEAADPFDHAGDVNVAGNLTASSPAIFQDDVRVDQDIALQSTSTGSLRLRTYDSSGVLNDRLTIGSGADAENIRFQQVGLLEMTSGSGRSILRQQAASDEDAIHTFGPNSGTLTWQLRAHADTNNTFILRELSSGNDRNVLEATPSSLDVASGVRFTHDNDDVVTSPDGDYELQKNGTDGQGVINFST